DAGPATLDYETVLDDEALERWIARIEAAELVAFDTETTSLDPMRAELVGLSLSVEPFAACYVPVGHRYAGAPAQLSREHVLQRLRGWLEDPARAKVGQNLKYDAHVLENHGVRLAGIAHDTLLESYVLEAHRNHDMDSLADRHLGRRTITYQDVAGKGASQIGFEQVAIDQATRYAAEDADVTMHLHRTLYPRIAEHERLDRIYRDIEIPVSIVLQRMERTGVLIDADALVRQSDELGRNHGREIPVSTVRRRMERAGVVIDADALVRQSDELGRKMLELERRAVDAAGQPFNLNTPKQLGEVLFGKLGLPVVRKTASGA